MTHLNAFNFELLSNTSEEVPIKIFDWSQKLWRSEINGAIIYRRSAFIRHRSAQANRMREQLRQQRRLERSRQQWRREDLLHYLRQVLGVHANERASWRQLLFQPAQKKHELEDICFLQRAVGMSSRPAHLDWDWPPQIHTGKEVILNSDLDKVPRSMICSAFRLRIQLTINQSM